MATTAGAPTSSAPIFAALGDETRLGIVARLCAGGPQSIARLTAGSAVTRQAVTKHLLVLADAGLVRSERRGRESRWALEPERLEVARRYLDHVSDQWRRRLEALARHLDALSDPEPPRPAEPAPRARRGRARARRARRPTRPTRAGG